MFTIAFSDSEVEKDEYGIELFYMVNEDKLSQLDINELEINLEKCYYRGHYLLDWAILNDKVEAINWILRNSVKKVGIPFHISVLKNNLEMLDLLYEWGYNSNKKNIDGDTPLHLAIKYNRRDLIKYFLRFNKSVNVNKLNKNLETPLKIALDLYYFDIAKVLILRGANFKNDMQINYFDEKIRKFLERENRLMINKVKNKTRKYEKFKLIKLYDSFKSSTVPLSEDLIEELNKELNIPIFEFIYDEIEKILLKKIFFYKIYYG